MDLTLPTPGTTTDWGDEVNAALTALGTAVDAANAAITAAQSSIDTVQSTIDNKVAVGTVYLKTEADGRFIRTVNGQVPVNGNIQVSPEPGLQVIRQSGTDYPTRATRSTDLTQPVIWAGAAQPVIGGAYAVDGVDIWWQLPS